MKEWRHLLYKARGVKRDASRGHSLDHRPLPSVCELTVHTEFRCWVRHHWPLLDDKARNPSPEARCFNVVN